MPSRACAPLFPHINWLGIIKPRIQPRSGSIVLWNNVMHLQIFDLSSYYGLKLRDSNRLQSKIPVGRCEVSFSDYTANPGVEYTSCTEARQGLQSQAVRGQSQVILSP